jgi:hypothetical protein
MLWRSIRLACTLACLIRTAAAGAQTVDVPALEPASPSARQAMDDAWWTGPMLANSASTLPRGHWLIEPYIYDIHAARADSYGSRAYVLYGLTDRLSVGVVPIIGYNTGGGGASSSHVLLGDFSVQAQYRLTQFEPGSWVPTTAIEVQETLPTGAYDRLGSNPNNGLGSGVYATTLQFNAQTYFWMPNGRILRMRLNLAQTVSGHASVDGVSVYGTGRDFRGRARPGNSFNMDLAWEYSLVRAWVLALDLTYAHSHGTDVAGYTMANVGSLSYPTPFRARSGSQSAFGIAPAIEYNWSPNYGVLFGTRVIFGGRRVTTTVTPAVALNMVF